jgi:hypothetical protein
MIATIGEVVKLKTCYYVVVNKTGTLEKLPKLKWYQSLICEIRQGMGLFYTVEQVRDMTKNNMR